MSPLECVSRPGGVAHGVQVGRHRSRRSAVSSSHSSSTSQGDQWGPPRILKTCIPISSRRTPSLSHGHTHTLPLQRHRTRHQQTRVSSGPEGNPKSTGEGPVTTVVEVVKGGVTSAAESVRQGVREGVEKATEKVSRVSEGVTSAVDAAAERVSLVGEITEEAVLETKAGELVDIETAVKTVAFWVAAAAVFGVGVGVVQGSQTASEFFAGYLLELSLSVDNLFVFVLIFDYFQVPPVYQSQVLSYGIAGAVVFRGILIGAGLTAVNANEGVLLLFSAVLLFSSFKLLQDGDDEEEDLSNNAIVSFCRRYIPVTDFYDGSNFFTVESGMKKATPLLLTLAVVELTDIFFAFDSIPAVFGVTQDPVIVLSSNLFGILGLRSMYTVIASSMADLRYLQPAIAGVLGFIGSKLLVGYFGFKISTETSLLVVAALLGAGVFLSLRFPKDEKDDSL